MCINNHLKKYFGKDCGGVLKNVGAYFKIKNRSSQNLFNILYLGEMEKDKVPVTNWLYMSEMFEKLIE